VAREDQRSTTSLWRAIPSTVARVSYRCSAKVVDVGPLAGPWDRTDGRGRDLSLIQAQWPWRIDGKAQRRRKADEDLGMIPSLSDSPGFSF
jgi:hypothetical protein